jgi:hypothetical protein
MVSSFYLSEEWKIRCLGLWGLDLVFFGLFCVFPCPKPGFDIGQHVQLCSLGTVELLSTSGFAFPVHGFLIHHQVPCPVSYRSCHITKPCHLTELVSSLLNEFLVLPTSYPKSLNAYIVFMGIIDIHYVSHLMLNFIIFYSHLRRTLEYIWIFPVLLLPLLVYNLYKIKILEWQ